MVWIPALLDCPCHILNGYIRIDTVLIEEVDAIGAQALEACLRDVLDVLRPAVGAAPTLTGYQVNVEAELGSDDHPITDRLKRLPDQFLVCEGTVGFRSIEQRDATFVGRANQLDHFLPVLTRSRHAQP